MSNFELEPDPAATRKEYYAFQQFLIDSKIISPPDVETQKPRQPVVVNEGRIGEVWKQQAACKNIPKSLFYDTSRIKDRDKTELRDRVCGGCAVNLTCIRYGLQFNDKYGVWGGFDFNIAKEKAAAKRVVAVPLPKRRRKSA